MKATKTIDIKFAKRVACAFEEMKHDPHNSEVRQCYSALATEVNYQYSAIIFRRGIEIEFMPKINPYHSPYGAMVDIQHNNHLYVYSTMDGFGSGYSDFPYFDSPMIYPSGQTISGRPALVNDLFRVVHDYYGHFAPDNGFRALGEENAYRAHCEMFSPDAIRALTTETRGQNSWLNFGPHGEANRTAKENKTIFADQKTGLLPAFCMEEY